jgi:hypothetical protein
VPHGERQRFLDRARTLRAHYTAANCQYWLFEDAQLGGAFIEFVESADPTALVAAHAAIAEPASFDPRRIYSEIDLSTGRTRPAPNEA